MVPVNIGPDGTATVIIVDSGGEYYTYTNICILTYGQSVRRWF